MTPEQVYLVALILVLGVIAIALMWVLAMREAFDSSVDDEADRRADERFREMCDNTEYRVHYDRYIVCGQGYQQQEDKITMYAQKITPQPGQIYVNRNGGTYRCLRLTADGDAVMMQMDTGWLLTAHDCRVYHDGQIDWLYSYNCKFMEGAVC